jgi:hypothetical protein
MGLSQLTRAHSFLNPSNLFRSPANRAPATLQHRLKTSRKIILALAVLVAVTTFPLGLRDQEPMCQGKTLSEWLDRVQMASGGITVDDPAVKAIAAMGESVIPRLVRELQVNHAPAYSKAISWANRTLKIGLREDWERWLRATVCLGQLGARAAPAVPDLVNIARDTHAGSRAFAIELLGTIRAPSDAIIPALLELTNDKDVQVSRSAQKALARRSTDTTSRF